MTFRKIFGLAAAALLPILSVAAPAQATLVTVTATFDPSTLSGNLFANTLPLNAPLVFDIGDTLDLTINFTGGSGLYFLNQPILGFGLVGPDTPDPINQMKTSYTFGFGGGTGPLRPSATVLGINTNCLCGAAFHFNFPASINYATGPGPISFTSLHVVMTLDSDDLGTARTYDAAYFSYDNAPSAAPEPASWALLLIGFGLVGTITRRGAAAATAAAAAANA